MLFKAKGAEKISNLEILKIVLYVMENGCEWRRLPKEYGDWYVIHARVNCLVEKGCAVRDICALATDGNHPNASKCSERGFHMHQSTFRRYGCFEKSSAQSVV